MLTSEDKTPGTASRIETVEVRMRSFMFGHSLGRKIKDFSVSLHHTTQNENTKTRTQTGTIRKENEKP